MKDVVRAYEFAVFEQGAHGPMNPHPYPNPTLIASPLTDRQTGREKDRKTDAR